MLNKIKIERKLNLKVEEMVDKVLELIPNKSTIVYESEKAQFVIGKIINNEDMYNKKISFHLDEIEEVNDFISNLKKDIVSDFVINISILIGNSPIVIINQKELNDFRIKLFHLENELYNKLFSKNKLKTS